MVVAVLSLVGALVSLYLWLWKIGWVGPVACGSDGGCQTVQFSDLAVLFGIPVAAYGFVGYSMLLVASMLGLQETWLRRREVTQALTVLSGAGVAFTAYLTYLEAFVLHAWCRWCLGSAAIIVAIFVTSLLGLRRLPSSESA